jgi:hypothetical protein
MRVTIEHREATSGVLGNHKESYVDCTVNFSEEERAIIKERDLYREGFVVRTSTPLPTGGSMLGTGLMRFVGPFMIVGGFIWGLAGGGDLAGLTLFAGIGFVIYGWLRARREDKRLETSEQDITVKQLLNNSTFTVHAWNPAAAKGIEEDIRGHLTSLKAVIQNSAEITPKQTFEL